MTLRLIVRRSPDGHQTPVLTNRTDLTAPEIETHVNRLFGKLGVRDRVQAVILAYECGLVAPGRRNN